ncbi:hypothetical protein CFC21_039334 [Triticum aestivum]|uniref:Uncharacterized protein n=3 Tax=Triticum TaxID=4564 RepID=A0A9R1JRS1_WHEAT|nr:uncharacterized protein LOC119280613 [Triticum dicoccoides]XP_044343923.1 uncharacterized protein LOC123064521 [Triticum aestivum]KAF7027280.1 hypothetical protein CFC21_039334 [Triticum aestivum]CDM80773.1 unnamed protein product [Triticum aestivum]VAH71622.1 unnamed protein product [Triticum turgidum subsp. durum]
MPRSSSAPRILGRAMAILSLPLTPLSKARAARTLLLFKKRRARRLRHYNYAYVGEYQFSPSGSPLLLPRPPGVSAWRAKRRSRARTVLAALLCGGGCGFDGDGGIDVAVLDGLLPLPRALQDERSVDDDGEEEACDGEEEEEVEVEFEGDEEVDGRAERFIERFYEEMRMQQRRLL